MPLADGAVIGLDAWVEIMEPALSVSTYCVAYPVAVLTPVVLNEIEELAAAHPPVTQKEAGEPAMSIQVPAAVVMFCPGVITGVTEVL